MTSQKINKTFIKDQLQGNILVKMHEKYFISSNQYWSYKNYSINNWEIGIIEECWCILLCFICVVKKFGDGDVN